jgi:hypothetical protein
VTWEGAREPLNWKKIKMFQYSLNNPLFDGAQEVVELINFLFFGCFCRSAAAKRRLSTPNTGVDLVRG